MPRGRPKLYTTKRQKEKAQQGYTKKWAKANTRTINVRYNIEKDSDILDKLDSVDNKADYIRTLIKKDLKDSDK